MTVLLISCQAEQLQPQMTDEQAKTAEREKTVFALRRRLQKGFLPQDHAPPKLSDMAAMACDFDLLESFAAEIEPSILRATKIQKVLRNIIKISAIPMGNVFRFKERCAAMIEGWNARIAMTASLSVSLGSTSTSPQPRTSLPPYREPSLADHESTAVSPRSPRQQTLQPRQSFPPSDESSHMELESSAMPHQQPPPPRQSLPSRDESPPMRDHEPTAASRRNAKKKRTPKSLSGVSNKKTPLMIERRLGFWFERGISRPAKAYEGFEGDTMPKLREHIDRLNTKHRYATKEVLRDSEDPLGLQVVFDGIYDELAADIWPDRQDAPWSVGEYPPGAPKGIRQDAPWLVDPLCEREDGTYNTNGGHYPHDLFASNEEHALGLRKHFGDMILAKLVKKAENNARDDREKKRKSLLAEDDFGYNEDHEPMDEPESDTRAQEEHQTQTPSLPYGLGVHEPAERSAASSPASEVPFRASNNWATINTNDRQRAGATAGQKRSAEAEPVTKTAKRSRHSKTPSLVVKLQLPSARLKELVLRDNQRRSVQRSMLPPPLSQPLSVHEEQIRHEQQRPSSEQRRSSQHLPPPPPPTLPASEEQIRHEQQRPSSEQRRSSQHQPPPLPPTLPVSQEQMQHEIQRSFSNRRESSRQLSQPQPGHGQVQFEPLRQSEFESMHFVWKSNDQPSEQRRLSEQLPPPSPSTFPRYEASANDGQHALSHVSNQTPQLPLRENDAVATTEATSSVLRPDEVTGQMITAAELDNRQKQRKQEAERVRRSIQGLSQVQPPLFPPTPPPSTGVQLPPQQTHAAAHQVEISQRARPPLRQSYQPQARLAAAQIETTWPPAVRQASLSAVAVSQPPPKTACIPSNSVSHAAPSTIPMSLPVQIMNTIPSAPPYQPSVTIAATQQAPIRLPRPIVAAAPPPPQIMPPVQTHQPSPITAAVPQPSPLQAQTPNPPPPSDILSRTNCFFELSAVGKNGRALFPLNILSNANDLFRAVESTIPKALRQSKIPDAISIYLFDSTSTFQLPFAPCITRKALGQWAYERFISDLAESVEVNGLTSPPHLLLSVDWE